MQFHNRVANISSNSRVKRSSMCDKPSLQINLVAIMAMGRVYEYMAERLTIWGQYTNIKYTVYSIQYTVYSIQYTVYSIQYTVYSIQYTVYSIQYTVYSVQLTV